MSTACQYLVIILVVAERVLSTIRKRYKSNPVLGQNRTENTSKRARKEPSNRKSKVIQVISSLYVGGLGKIPVVISPYDFFILVFLEQIRYFRPGHKRVWKWHSLSSTEGR